VKALSVRAPWWWVILHGKPIENRDWYTSYRGPVLLQASKAWNREDIACDWADALDMAAAAKIELPKPDWHRMKACGVCIVGMAHIVDCVQSHPSPFFVGKYGFVLDGVKAAWQPVPLKGMLGLFDVDSSLAAMAGLL